MSKNSDEGSAILKVIHKVIDDCVLETVHAENEIPLSKLQSNFNLLGSAYAHHSESDVNSSLLLRRILEWIRLTSWAQIAILSGVYESALRELRYLIEDVLVTVIADKRNPEGSVEDRLKTVNELEIKETRKRGTRLINLCRTEMIIQNDEIKDLLIEQYDKLCNFTHPSRKIVEQSIDIDRYFKFSYNSERYRHAIELYVKTVDCLLVILFWHMDKRAQKSFAIFFCNRPSRWQDFVETNRICSPLAEKWWNDVVKDAKRQFGND